MERDTALHDFEIQRVVEKDRSVIVEASLQGQHKTVVFEGVHGISRWFCSSQRSIQSIEVEPCEIGRLKAIGFHLPEDGLDTLPKFIAHIEFHTADEFSVACDRYYYLDE